MWRLLVVPDLSGVDTLPPCSSRPGDAEEHHRRRGQIAAPRWRENRRDTESIAARDGARQDECRGGGRARERRSGRRGGGGAPSPARPLAGRASGGDLPAAPPPCPPPRRGGAPPPPPPGRGGG